MDSGFEQFPVEKMQLEGEEPPEMFFFDVDEETEEAEFIRLDDLLRREGESVPVRGGPTSFTFFPRKYGTILKSRFSRLLRRTLILSASGMQYEPEKIRIRPLFVQWQIDLSETDDPEKIAREFRADLETQTCSLLDLDDHESYWSDCCFISPADARVTDEVIIRLASRIQKNGYRGSVQGAEL